MPIISSMRRNLPPITAVAAATAWLLAQAMNSWLIGAITLAAAVAIGCGASLTRTPRRLLAIAAICGALASFALILFVHEIPQGRTPLFAQLAYVLLIGSVLPTLYAFSFPTEKLNRKRQ